MPQVVNFAHQLSKQRSKIEAKDRQFLVQATVVAVIVGVITAVALGGRVIVSAAQARAEKQYDSLLTTIESQKSQEIEYAEYARKVNILSELFTNRQAKQEAFARFRFLFGEGVTITGLSYDVGDNALGFQLQADNIFILEKVLDRLAQDDIKLEYPEIKKEAVGRSEDGSYRLKITVRLDKA